MGLNNHYYKRERWSRKLRNKLPRSNTRKPPRLDYIKRESSPHSEDPDAINGKNKLWSKSKTANLRLTLNGTWERESLMFTKLRTPRTIPDSESNGVKSLTPTDLSVWSESSSQSTSLDAPLEPTSE